MMRKNLRKIAVIRDQSNVLSAKKWKTQINKFENSDKETER